VRGAPKWQCSIAGNIFPIEGYLYAQQNTITNVCAHVAARTAASVYHKEGDMLYREMNKIVGVDHQTRILGRGYGKGLDTDEIKLILEAAGAKVYNPDYAIIDNSIPPPPPFQKFIYGSVESGFPVIVIFEKADDPRIKHAIPIFGHTFNEDTWVHRAEDSYFKIGSKTEYIPSESWASMYIGHDDNWGSNFYVPRHYLHTRRECIQGGRRLLCSNDTGCVTRVIATFPKEVEVDAIRAEAIGADYLFSILEYVVNDDDLQKKTNWLKPWPKRLEYYWQNDKLTNLVLRPILITQKDYSDHLRKISDWDGNPIDSDVVDIFAEGFNSEKRVWMIELSLPELFSTNRRKLGEVLLAADVRPASQRDFKNFILARLLGHLYFYDSGGPNNPKYELSSCGAEGHVELYGCEENKKNFSFPFFSRGKNQILRWINKLK